jgi:hypothetical protein
VAIGNNASVTNLVGSQTNLSSIAGNIGVSNFDALTGIDPVPVAPPAQWVCGQKCVQKNRHPRE